MLQRPIHLPGRAVTVDEKQGRRVYTSDTDSFEQISLLSFSFIYLHKEKSNKAKKAMNNVQNFTTRT